MPERLELPIRHVQPRTNEREFPKPFFDSRKLDVSIARDVARNNACVSKDAVAASSRVFKGRVCPGDGQMKSDLIGSLRKK